MFLGKLKNSTDSTADGDYAKLSRVQESVSVATVLDTSGSWFIMPGDFGLENRSTSWKQKRHKPSLAQSPN
jgi:hypothetical protein